LNENNYYTFFCRFLFLDWNDDNIRRLLCHAGSTRNTIIHEH